MTVRLNEKEYERIREEARSAGVSVSTYLRAMAFSGRVLPRPPEDLLEGLRALQGLEGELENLSLRKASSVEIAPVLTKISAVSDRLWEEMTRWH